MTWMATMPKKNDGEITDQSVRIAGDVVKMARMIDAVRGGGISKIISDTCRPVFAKLLKQMAADGEFEPPKPK